MAKRLTTYILIGLVLGLIVGFAINASIDDGSPAAQAQLTQIADYFSIVTSLFLRLIKMIIAPLVFATLVSGIAQMGDTAALGRIGARSLGWFICASLLSLSLGLLLVNLFHPGVGVNLPLPPVTAATGVETTGFNLKDFITHIVPASMVDAMAKNEVLQIVRPVALRRRRDHRGRREGGAAGEGDRRAGARDAPDHRLRDARRTARGVRRGRGHADRARPRGHRPARLFSSGTFYLALILLWAILIGVGTIFIGGRIRALLGYVREPLLVAFSTASSEAAYPRMLEALDRFGIPPRIASFVLPLGYSFNLDGSMMYMAFASLFIAQAYGIDMSLGQQITLLLVLMSHVEGDRRGARAHRWW